MYPEYVAQVHLEIVDAQRLSRAAQAMILTYREREAAGVVRRWRGASSMYANSSWWYWWAAGPESPGPCPNQSPDTHWGKQWDAANLIGEDTFELAQKLLDSVYVSVVVLDLNEYDDLRKWAEK